MGKAPHEEAAHLWFEKADKNLGAARDLLKAALPKAEAAAFHCQQAAEKDLKGFLVYHGKEPPYTHNLRNLLGLAVQFEDALLSLREAVDYLLPFAVDIRYPGTDVSATEEEAKMALRHALHIRDAIHSCLPL